MFEFPTQTLLSGSSLRRASESTNDARCRTNDECVTGEGGLEIDSGVSIATRAQNTRATATGQ